MSSCHIKFISGQVVVPSKFFNKLQLNQFIISAHIHTSFSVTLPVNESVKSSLLSCSENFSCHLSNVCILSSSKILSKSIQSKWFMEEIRLFIVLSWKKVISTKVGWDVGVQSNNLFSISSWLIDILALSDIKEKFSNKLLLILKSIVERDIYSQFALSNWRHSLISSGLNVSSQIHNKFDHRHLLTFSSSAFDTQNDEKKIIKNNKDLNTIFVFILFFIYDFKKFLIDYN